MSATDAPRRHDMSVAASVHPTAVATAAPCASPAAMVTAGEPFEAAPLSMITCWKRPALFGDARCRNRLVPPADSPKTVTFLGSPPNPAQFFWTHWIAAI